MDTNYAARDGRAAADRAPRVGSGPVRLLRAGFVVALLAQGFLLYAQVPSTSDVALFPHIDKVVHAGIFALPAALAVLARLPLWIVGTVLAAHAPVSELVQHYAIAGRFGDPLDMLADWGGIGLGLAAGSVVARWRRRR